MLCTLTPAAHAAEPRDLPPAATFGELVQTALDLARAGQGASRSGCLLRRVAAGSQLAAQIHPAGDAAPPPADLDAVLQAPLQVSLATAAGRIGAATGLQLASLVPTPRAFGQGILPVLLVTDQGTYFTAIAPDGTFGGGGARAQLLKAADFARLKADVLPRAQGVVVTAEGDVPVTRFIEALTPLADYPGAVVLATVGGGTQDLAPSAALTPAGALPAGHDAPDVCRGGIMDIPPGQRPGAPPAGPAFAAIERIQRAAQRACGQALPPDGGGELKVATRILANGRVGRACIERDTTGDKALRNCVLDVVRRQTLPRPQGGTFANFGFEVKLVPPGLAQRAVCSAAR